MKTKVYILALLFFVSLLPQSSGARQTESSISFDFYGEQITIPFDQSLFVDFTAPLSEKSLQLFYQRISVEDYAPVIKALLAYKIQYRLDDWLYYQLIRKTAQQVSPKAANYHRYTLYKWYLLTGSGYDALLSIKADRILFYVQTDENIYNIPGRLRNGKQYICLNYHDYGVINFERELFAEVALPVPGAVKGFSYKVMHLPDFKKTDYQEKDISFNYNEQDYHFKLRLNPQIKTIFANYPVVDYESYFNIPLSQETYSSLIPLLKKNIKGMSQKNGVDFLMRFTRYAFLFEPDSRQFGNEKRLSPEQTLLYEQSDCDDRAALFFYLVKEIYNLPMLVLAFPEHVTIAVKFDKPVGTPIMYKGEKYSVCEPTPQKQDLKLGQLSPNLDKATYEIAYAYIPRN